MVICYCSITLPVLVIIGFCLFVCFSYLTLVILEAGRKVRRPFQKGIGSSKDKEWTVSMRTGTALILLTCGFLVPGTVSGIKDRYGENLCSHASVKIA